MEVDSKLEYSRPDFLNVLINCPLFNIDSKILHGVMSAPYPSPNPLPAPVSRPPLINNKRKLDILMSALYPSALASCPPLTIVIKILNSVILILYWVVYWILDSVMLALYCIEYWILDSVMSALYCIVHWILDNVMSALYLSSNLLPALVSCPPLFIERRILDNVMSELYWLVYWILDNVISALYPSPNLLPALDSIISDPYPSPAELAHFANAVYSEMTDQLPQELKLQDWELLVTARNDTWNNGYFGAAFYSPSRQQVVLAHRGTIPSNFGSWWTNIMGVAFNNYTSRMSSAVTFAAKVKSAIEEANKRDGLRFHLSITGHSLGGWLAQVTGFNVKFLQAEGGKFIKIRDARNGLHAHVVAFDSPGCGKMLLQIIDTSDVRYDRPDYLQMLDITSYMSAPNRINTYGLHVGSVLRVMIYVSKFNLWDRFTLKYNLKTHIMTYLKDALQSNRAIHEMKDWPVSNIKENLLKIWRKTEYKTFHENVTHTGEYDLESSECDSLETRYKKKPSSEYSVSLRVFSDDEMKFLKVWMDFKRDSLQMNEIQNFFDTYGLGTSNNLFENSSIHIKNHTITCDSEKTLEMVVKRTKLLVRWFRAELMAAMHQQKNAKPKMMYSNINLKFFDPLPDDLLEFKINSIELKVFLESDHHIWQIKTEDRELEMIGLNSVCRQLWGMSAVSNMYKYHECQTFLRWKDIDKLSEDVDIANLPGDFTNNNLWVIDCDSTFVNDLIIRPFFANIKKIIFVCDHKFAPSIEGFLVIKSSFISSELTMDSQKILFVKEMLDIGGTISSIAEFIGEQNFDYFSSNINSFIDSSNLINILKSDKYVIKMKNLCPNFIESPANFSTIERVVSVKDLARIASSGGLLAVSGDHQAELGRRLTEATSGAAGRVIWMPGTGSAGEEGFKRAILDYPDDKVYWLEANDPSTASTVKQIYHKSFYLTRRFHRQVVFRLKNYASLSESEDIFIFEGAASKESLACSLAVSESDREKFIKNINILTAPSGGKRNYGKPVHWLKLEENGERFLWQSSQGSMEALRPHLIIDTGRVVTEHELVESTKKVVIIADEPGMGKSTSLASMIRQMRSAWVIWVNLKYFKNPSNNKLPELEQLEQLIDDRWSRELLRFCLRNKHKRQLYCLFDGFDEVKDSSKNAVLKMLQCLKNNTEAIIWVTTRFHDQQLLEDSLSTIAWTFKKITEQAQRDYLQNFWRSHLLLEPGSCGDKLEKCARDVFSVAAKNLGGDIQNFMGVPLQMRMLAEVFLQRVEDHITSHTESETAVQVENVFSLYKEFMNGKYNIYCKGKIQLNVHENDYTYATIITEYQKCHRKLGFLTLFPQSAQQFCENYENTSSQLDEMLRVGLVQSGGEGREVEFIHRTLAEYFCADLIVHWLGKKTHWHGWAPMVELLVSDILLLDSNYVIRMFLNNFLQLRPAPPSALEYIAAHIEKRWSDESQETLINRKKQTALHVAIEESNTKIANLLIGGFGTEKHQKGLNKFLEARDTNKCTALHRAAGEGHLPLVRLLAEKGADVNTGDYNSDTALHWAAQKGDFPLVQLLAEKGADINLRDNKGRIALHYAARGGQLPVVRFLAEKGADINKEDKDGWTALRLADLLGHTEIVQYLKMEGGR